MSCREDRRRSREVRRKKAAVIKSRRAARRSRKEWLRMERQEQEEGEKLPSKNSEFMGRAGRDKVGEMREEIEGKKRRDHDTEGRRR